MRWRVVIVTSIALLASSARAQPVPAPLVEVGVDERVGSYLPVNARFEALGVGPVTLGELTDRKRPLLLVMAYARCAMLCSLVLRGVAKVVNELAVAPGREFQLVVVGLDHRETVDEARRVHATLAAMLTRGSLVYLHGDRASIDQVADALGVRYRWDPRSEQYAHPAVIVAITPAGQIARYLHGIEFHPREVENALLGAREGRLVTAAAADVLRCFRYDPATRTAGKRAELALRLGAALIFLLLLAMVGGLFAWERRRRTS